MQGKLYKNNSVSNPNVEGLLHHNGPGTPRRGLWLRTETEHENETTETEHENETTDEHEVTT